MLLMLIVDVVVVVVGGLLLRIVVGGTVLSIPVVSRRDREFDAFSCHELERLVKITQRGLLFARAVLILVITAIRPWSIMIPPSVSDEGGCEGGDDDAIDRRVVAVLEEVDK